MSPERAPLGARVSDWLGDLRGRALVVVLGCFICQLTLGAGYVFSPLAPDLLAEFGWSRAEYSTARSSQLLLLGLTSPLVGLLVVRIGTRPILLTAIVILGAVFAGFTQMQSFTQFAVLIGIMGIAVTGCGDVTVGQLVSQWVAKRRGLALGIVYTGSNFAGWMLVPLVVDLSDANGWRHALATLSLGAFFFMLPVAWLLVREPPRALEDTPTDLDAPASTIVRADDMKLVAALRTRSFWILAFSLFTFFFYFVTVIEHLVLFLTDEGLPRGQAAGYLATAIGLGMVSKIALGLLADCMHPKQAIVLDYALLAASSLLLLLIPPTSPLLWIFVGCYGFATAARDVVYPLIVNHCFGVRYMAEIYGAIMLALIPGGMLGPIFAAWVHDLTGGYTVSFGVMVAGNLAAVAMLALLRDERAGARAPLPAYG